MSQSENIVSVPAQETQQEQEGYRPKPAFHLHRFKKTLCITMNEEMGNELSDVLGENEERQKQVPPYLYEFLSQLNRALDQKAPRQQQRVAG